MKIELRGLEAIVPYDKNPRQNDQAVDAVAASLQEFGFRQPIVVDKLGVIVVGHTRWKAAKKLGLEQVPVHVAIDLSPEQARAYRIADNQTAAIAEWDFDLLPTELMELQEAEFDLDLLGFSADDLTRIMGDEPTEGLTDPDDVPEPPDEATTRPGDLWVLGDHRLLCGDATTRANAERLMESDTASMVFTDPPWNCAIGSDKNPKHRQRAGLQNDDIDQQEYEEFLRQFIEITKGICAGDVYCVLGAAQWPTLDGVMRSEGFHWSSTIIWVKQQFVLGRSKYHRRYEPIWYGWHGTIKSSFVGGRSLDDVWECDRPFISKEHPTMKPVELVARAIENSSSRGGIVYEPFLGSGTTLIAAEQLGRKCYGIEISPLYCDVIVQRFEKFTGKQAERIPAAR